MNEVARLKETILKDYPRYKESDRFQFRCHRHLRCFNSCCADVNIFLTPYDVIRMRARLSVSSREFLDTYTLLPIEKNQKYPVVVLRMSDTPGKQCPFVSEREGCTIYEDRPWACRMYPVGIASPKDTGANGGGDFYFLMEDPGCEGFREDAQWTIEEWMDNQGVREYDELGVYFKDVVLHDKLQSGPELNPGKMQMLFMVCYDLDTFRRFVFESSFLDKFDIDDDLQARIRESDVELMKFGFQWLRFSLFGEPTMNIKPRVVDAKREELDRRNAAGAAVR